jgi:hypothetical protein
MMKEQIFLGTAVLQLEDQPAKVIINATTITAKDQSAADRKLLRMANAASLNPTDPDEFDNNIQLVTRPF